MCMSEPLKIFLLTFIYILGIVCFFNSLFFIFAFLFLFALTYIYIKKKPCSFNYLCTIFLFFFISIINTSLHLNYDDDLVSFADNDVKIEAKVLSIPTNNKSDKTKFYAKVFTVENDNVKYNLNKAKCYVTITDKTEKIEKIKIGDTIKMSGYLKTPSLSVNPSQFDYARYLQFKNTFSLLYVTEDWEILSPAADFKGKLIAKLNDTRTNILNIHAQNIKSPMIEVLGGMIFGDDAVNPDEETKSAFIKSGIFHILSASGMNVTLIFGIWFFFAKNLRFNYKFSILSGILMILVYTCMTGFGPPVIRAFLMLTLILLGKLINRQTSTLGLLFFVALFMLLINPLMIFDIGFQLSFIVTFALIFTAPLIRFNFKFKFLNCILGACMIPCIAQLYAAPLQMFCFNTFSLYAVFANIAIIPVLSIVSFLGFMGSVIALIPFLAQKICFAVDFILNPLLIYIVKVADFFSSLSLNIIEIQKPSVLQILLYFSFLISTTYILLKKYKRKRLFFVPAGLILLFSLTFIPDFAKQTEVIYFSVGNADAILIKSPSGKYFLIDTAKLPYNTSSSQADYIIIKYLKDKGVKNLNSLILSHFDSDHAGGTINILQKLKTENIYHPDTYENTRLSAEIIDYVKQNKLNSKIITNDTLIYKEKNFTIKAIKPVSPLLKDENDKSVIVLLNSFNKKFLFMGDGGINSYNSLPENYKNNITVLKSGHHGAEKTLNSDILKNVSSVIISTGKNNYNHPHFETINMLNDENKTYFRTDWHNAIKVSVNDRSFNYYLYSPAKKKFIDFKKK